MNTETRKKNFKFVDKRDFVIIRRILGGDVDAFKHIHDKYYKYLYFAMYKKTSNATTAEDLAMNVLGKVYKNLHKYKTTDTFNSWISTIARNEVTDYYRVNGRKPNTVSVEAMVPRSHKEGETVKLVYELKSCCPAPDKILERKERHAAVRAAIEKLDDLSAAIVTKVYFEEKSYVQTAEELGVTIHNVKTKLFRAKKKMKELLK
jgi:RNA polymerase sigma-70 factor (ECF subfamily)